MVRELQEAGIDARPVDEVEIEVPITGEVEAASDEIFARTEQMIMSLGAPFVPIKHEGVIYIRPPTS